jgi:multiple sugar transport system substrate-binding protein
MIPQMNSPCAVEVTKIWLELMNNSGIENWLNFSENQMMTDFNQGKITMVISDAFPNLQDSAYTFVPYSQNIHIGVESLVMNARSKHKNAAWLFMQWATSKDVLSNAAINYHVLNPGRASVWENPDFQETRSPKNNYLETFNTLIASDMKVQLTPQPLFFETTSQWAQALQDIYAGADIQQRLDELASSISEQLKYARLE